jgi:hypothetical protein
MYRICLFASNREEKKFDSENNKLAYDGYKNDEYR